MSDRLSINFRTQGQDRPIATIFFRNSASARCSVTLSMRLFTLFYSDEFLQTDDPRLRLIRICEYLGGGIDGNEWKYITGIYPDLQFKSEKINSDYGLIALSDEGIDSMNRICQGSVDISIGNCIDDCSFRSSLIIQFTDYDEMLESLEDESDDFPGAVGISLSADLTGELSYQDLQTLNDSLTEDNDYYECDGRYYLMM